MASFREGHGKWALVVPSEQEEDESEFLYRMMSAPITIGECECEDRCTCDD